MAQESSKYTAFSTPEGHFKFTRTPLGLKNAPATFQRMMDNALRGLVDGMKPNPEKIKTAKEFRTPVNVTEIQSLFKLAGYYRKFI